VFRSEKLSLRSSSAITPSTSLSSLLKLSAPILVLVWFLVDVDVDVDDDDDDDDDDAAGVESRE